MKCISRFEKYRGDDLDGIILSIKNGTIKVGKYSHLVKVDGNKVIDRKELFADGKNSKSK